MGTALPLVMLGSLKQESRSIDSKLVFNGFRGYYAKNPFHDSTHLKHLNSLIYHLCLIAT